MANSTELIPLQSYPTPPFPTNVFPSWLGDYVDALTIEKQTPPDLAGMLALAVLATALAKRVAVRPYANSSWKEPVNLFVVVALPPASRKSAVFAAMTLPIMDYENRLRRMSMLEAKPTAASEDRNLGEGPPKQPLLFVDDTTPEALVSLLAQNGGRMAALSAEGDLFDIMAGRYTKEPNLNVFLKGHSGDHLRVHRIGRPEELLPAPALTLGLCAQPVIIEELGTKPDFRGRGLLARVLFSLPENTVGRREIASPGVPGNVAVAYGEQIGMLLSLRAAMNDADRDAPHVLALDPTAEALFTQFEKDIEPRLGEFGDLASIVDWAGKLVGTVARIAGLLHVAEHVDELDPLKTQIEAATLERAIAIGNYLTSHAQAAFGLMGADKQVENAKRIMRWIQCKNVHRFSKRDAFQSLKCSRLPTADRFDEPLSLLIAHGYIAAEPLPGRAGPGRSPSPVYLVHDDVLAA